MFPKLFSNLPGIFKNKSAPAPAFTPDFTQDPVVGIEVRGFEVDVKRKDPALVFYKTEKEGDEKKRADVNFYFEVAIRQTGENADYPERAEPYKMIVTHATGLDKDLENDHGGGSFYIPKNSQLSRIVIRERHSDDDMHVIALGRVPTIPYPPHHTTYVQLYATGEDGRERQISGWGLQTRLSEMQTPAWKKSEQSPHVWTT